MCTSEMPFTGKKQAFYTQNVTYYFVAFVYIYYMYRYVP